MLPDNNNDSWLFAVDEKEKTLTFGLKESTHFIGSRTSAMLGYGVLGELIMGNDDVEKEYDYVVGGNVDGVDALRQSIFLTLNVEADQFIIYPYTHGINTLDLIGKPIYYVMAVIPGRIKEALLQDDRITDVSNFEFESNKNTLVVKFTVHSIYGEVAEETEVLY